MLDVIHTLFEDDVIPMWERHQEAKDGLRSSLYNNLYGREYKYALKRDANRDFTPDEPEMMDLPPEQQPTKPYIAPTNPEDLPGLLDGPMN